MDAKVLLLTLALAFVGVAGTASAHTTECSATDPAFVNCVVNCAVHMVVGFFDPGGHGCQVAYP